MDTLKILVVSQKGGVGKSTLSANLSVWFSEKVFKSTVLLDLDPHGSSSTWVKEARSSSVVTEHCVLDDFDARRWLIDCRNRVRRHLNKVEILGGRYKTNGSPQNYDLFLESLPMKITSINCKGKFIWF